jgi:hypothetical protein
MSTPDSAQLVEHRTLVERLTLPDDLLARLIADVDGDGVVGVALGGSFARGAGTAYSDVDLALFYADTQPLPPKRFFYRDGLLVSVSPKTCAGWRGQMARPETAIYAVPSARDLRILLDRDGTLAALIEEAQAFLWETLQAAADVFASRTLMLEVEHAHKVLGALTLHDESALCRALQELLHSLPWAVATQRGIMVVSGNTYYRQLEESTGEDSIWTRRLREALGAAPVQESEAAGLTAIEARGAATLRLYVETVALLQDAIQPEERAVVEQVMQIIERARYGLRH